VENLQRGDVGGLFPLGTLLDFKADLLALLKRFEAASLNLGEVRKQVFAAAVRVKLVVASFMQAKAVYPS
jgi:hypothetical protein